MLGLDLTSLYTTIGGVLGIQANTSDKLNFYGQLKTKELSLCLTTEKYPMHPLPCQCSLV